MNQPLTLFASDIKQIRSLQQKKYRKESGLFVVEGVKTVQELIGSNIQIDGIYTTEPFDFLNELNSELVHIIKEKELERISGLKNPNRILAVAKIPTTTEIDTNAQFVLILDGISDPGNLGTIIRTAKWFGVETIICSEDCADAYDRKVVQSTMGALFHVNVRYADIPVVMTKLKSDGFEIMGSGMTGESIYECARPTRSALVIGSESHGISTEVLSNCDHLVTIPNNELNRKVESLNAAIATSILLSEFSRKK